MNFTEKQIEDLKTKYGEIFEVSAGEMSCILRKPTRQELSLAMTLGQKDPVAIPESIIRACWLAGDEDCKTDLGFLVGVAPIIDGLLEIKKGELKKL